MDSTYDIEKLVLKYRKLGIDRQIDYNKFYLYSIVTHSTAIEGSTITEIENQLLFDDGISVKGKPIAEQLMNIDLKNAYESAISIAKKHCDITIDMLKKLAAMVMKNTGQEYHTALGDFSSANGDLRLVNVTAGFGGKSYMDFAKVPTRLQEFCDWVNNARRKMQSLSIVEQYNLCFDAHYQLVTIHPWADGNGRMSRLIMNYLQFEFGLIPTKILSSSKEEYINTLIATRESNDLTIFRNFMLQSASRNMAEEIEQFEKTAYEAVKSREKKSENGNGKQKSREKIITLLAQNPQLTMAQLSAEIGISAKAIEKHIANLKKDGKLLRIGPDKGGRWKVI